MANVERKGGEEVKTGSVDVVQEGWRGGGG
jgi:hypothetical protein